MYLNDCKCLQLGLVCSSDSFRQGMDQQTLEVILATVMAAYSGRRLDHVCLGQLPLIMVLLTLQSVRRGSAQGSTWAVSVFRPQELDHQVDLLLLLPPTKARLADRVLYLASDTQKHTHKHTHTNTYHVVDYKKTAGPYVTPSDGSCSFNPDSSSTCGDTASVGTRRICPCTCPV
jgi:hypothetical protein